MLDWGCDGIVVPDVSETFDGPRAKMFSRIPEGGPLLADMASSRTILTLGGRFQMHLAGGYLENAFGVPHIAVPLPIRPTDLFIGEIERRTGLDVLVGSSNGRQISKNEKIPLGSVGPPCPTPTRWGSAGN